MKRLQSWLPWKYLLRRAARRRGFLDPVNVLARLRQFSQPSEVQEPIELIRAGVAFHARGLVNTKVLQNNLDWVWPYWATRQFDPADPAFLPRAFSFTHVNLTHRNWTAVGLPGMKEYPIVDPRGLVTPRHDGWSLDWWFIPRGDGAPLFPSRSEQAYQKLDYSRGLAVTTKLEENGTQLESSAAVDLPHRGDAAEEPELNLRARIRSRHDGFLVLALRPANPEGVSFIDQINCEADTVTVNGETTITVYPRASSGLTSNYANGDVATRLTERGAPESGAVRCAAGLATGALLWPVSRHTMTEVSAQIPLPGTRSEEMTAPPAARPSGGSAEIWTKALQPTPELHLPVPHWRELHAAALHTLLLLSPDEVFPGPYTYRRFWFRDACLILNALIAANELELARRVMAHFPTRQKRDGYFHSQEGEWDANGQVLWIADKLEQASHRPLDEKLWQALIAGADWIDAKRIHDPDTAHHGLLPPGFSAEHLGPNDYYYWDDLWGLAGLRAAARMAARRRDDDRRTRWTAQADALAGSIQASWAALPDAVSRFGLPASPYRRLDSGAIGTMVADYPLQLDELGVEPIKRTADWLTRHSLHQGGFFQNMIHSGVNAYLTLDLAQTLLRHGDARYRELVDAVAAAASPTGQWPEAIHPHTGGGCMGDGQHAWAAAEWLLMMRALFVREESDHLVIGAGIDPAWLEDTTGFLSYGPTATAWGTLTVRFDVQSPDRPARCSVHADWHAMPPPIKIRVPGFKFIDLPTDQTDVELQPDRSAAHSR